MKFSERLRQLGFATYADYLASDQWKAFKTRYREAGQRVTCLICNAGRVQLHHHTYVRLGSERFTDVDPLCREHHEAVHAWLKESGKKFVEYTHEAIAALGGTVAPLTAAERGRAFGLRKRDERRAAKQRKRKAKRLRRERQEPEVWPPQTDNPEVASLIEQAIYYGLTKRQRIAVCRFIAANDINQLRGFLRSLGLLANAKSRGPRRSRGGGKSNSSGEVRARLQAARKEFQELKMAKGTPKKNLPIVVQERKKWEDPLHAIRMLGNGHRPPPK